MNIPELGHVYTILPGYIECGYQCTRCGQQWSMVYQETVLEKTPDSPPCRNVTCCLGTAQRTFARRHRVKHPE